MTEQPVEPMTEQQFLGNEDLHIVPAGVLADGIAARFGIALGEGIATPAVPAPLQSYLPNGHRIRYAAAPAEVETLEISMTMDPDSGWWKGQLPDGRPVITRMDRSETPAKSDMPRQEADLWLDAEVQATKALQEIQDGNINAAIAYLQSALAFAQNYRHGLRFEVSEA